MNRFFLIIALVFWFSQSHGSFDDYNQVNSVEDEISQTISDIDEESDASEMYSDDDSASYSNDSGDNFSEERRARQVRKAKRLKKRKKIRRRKKRTKKRRRGRKKKRSRWALSAVAGTSHLDLTGEFQGNFLEKVRFGGGVLFQYGKKKSFEFGLLYLPAGGVISKKINESSRLAELNLNYLAVPLNGKYHFRLSRSVRMYLKGGMNGMILLSHDLSKVETTSNVIQLQDSDVKDDIASFDVMLSLGLGFQYKVSRSLSLEFEGNFNRGALPVYSGNGDQYSHGLQFLGGLSYHF